MHLPSDVQIVGIMITTNLVLRLTHFILWQIHNRKKYAWNEHALAAVTIAMATVSWMGMSLHAPENKVDKP